MTGNQSPRMAEQPADLLDLPARARRELLGAWPLALLDCASYRVRGPEQQRPELGLSIWSETSLDAGQGQGTAVTLEALRDYVVSLDTEREALGQETELLFVWPNGRPLHPDTITALFHQRCERAGLPRIRLHDVRHSYATPALEAGIPAKVISERLGHSTAAFTLQTYTHVIPGMDELAADAIARMILTPAVADGDAGGRIAGSITEDAAPDTSKEPADLLRFRRSAGSSSSSGGRI